MLLDCRDFLAFRPRINTDANPLSGFVRAENGDEYYNQDKLFLVIARVWDSIISCIKIATIANRRSCHGVPYGHG